MVVLADYCRPMQSDQPSPIGADMTSATSLSHSIYNLLLYGTGTEERRNEKLGKDTYVQFEQ